MKVKEFLKKKWKKLVAFGLVMGLSVSVLAACGQKTHDVSAADTDQEKQIEIPADKEQEEEKEQIINSDDENQDDNQGENQGENSGENQGENSGENQGENSGENQDENQGGNQTNPGDENKQDEEQGNQGGDEDETQNDQPQQEDPAPANLDFSGLEEKVMSLLEYKNTGVTIDEVISFSINESKIYVLYDAHGDGGSAIDLCEIALNENDSLETQEAIDSFANSLKAKRLNISCLIGKSSTDIEVNGETYSKEGIEGDNPFARQCGVDNAYMTWVSEMGMRTFGSYDSGYCRGLDIMIFDSEYNISKIHATVDAATSTGNHWDNLFIEGKYMINIETQIQLGESLTSETQEEIQLNK